MQTLNMDAQSCNHEEEIKDENWNEIKKKGKGEWVQK
jgi:hypothetical protein